jgi:hypothetical protein
MLLPPPVNEAEAEAATARAVAIEDAKRMIMVYKNKNYECKGKNEWNDRSL